MSSLFLKLFPRYHFSKAYEVVSIHLGLREGGFFSLFRSG